MNAKLYNITLSVASFIVALLSFDGVQAQTSSRNYVSTLEPLFAEKYHDLSPYASRANSPFHYVDFDGSRTTLHTSTLPGFLPGVSKEYNLPTHSFISITKDKTGKLEGYYALGSEYNGVKGAFSGRLKRCVYDQDLDIILGKDKTHEKMRVDIPPPQGLSSEEFDRKVIDVAESFGNNSEILYKIIPTKVTEGNCNTSTSTILLKAGVPKAVIEFIKKNIPGIALGFNSCSKPWTKEE